MPSSSINISWLGEQVIARCREVSNAKLRNMAETTTELAKDNSPVLTGHNKSTITWDEQDGVFRVYTQSGYGAWLELGTTKMPARPYIYPAYVQAREELRGT